MKKKIIKQEGIIVIFVLIPLLFSLSLPQQKINAASPLTLNGDYFSFSAFFHYPSISKTELEFGDIVFKYPDMLKGPRIIDHCLLFVGYNTSLEQYEFIEAHYHSGVQIRFVSEDELYGNTWGPYCRVKTANRTQKQHAIQFAKKQLGKPFQGEWVNKNFDPTDTSNDSLANNWYCSELIWAAYYNCNQNFSGNKLDNEFIYGDGIDIDFNEWANIGNFTIVAPRDMLWDDDVRRIFPRKKCQQNTILLFQ